MSKRLNFGHITGNIPTNNPLLYLLYLVKGRRYEKYLAMGGNECTVMK